MGISITNYIQSFVKAPLTTIHKLTFLQDLVLNKCFSGITRTMVFKFSITHWCVVSHCELKI